MSFKEVALASSISAATYFVLGQISYKSFQGWLQEYNPSLPAAVNGALFAGVGVVLAQLFLGVRMNWGLVGSAAGGAAVIQMALGGPIFSSIVDAAPWSYKYIAPIYTGIGVMVGYGFYKLMF